MINFRMVVWAIAGAALGCGGGSSGSVDAAQTDASTTDGGGGTDTPVTIDAPLGGPLAVTGFDVYSTFGANYLTCDAAGACYGNASNIYKLPANGTMYSIIGYGNGSNGLVTATPSSILVDPPGNVYTNACGGVPGVYKLPVGTTQWVNFGTGFSGSNVTSCNWNTMGVDAAGTLYVGMAIAKEVWKLPAGQTVWTSTGTGLPDVVRATATRGNDVYVAHNGGVSVLTAGASTWTTVGTGHPGGPLHLTFDAAGNLYTTGGTGSTVSKLAAGTTTWVATTNITTTDSYTSNAVFDAANNGYIVTRDNGGNVYSLMKLAAGTLAWTKVLDTTVFLSEDCLALADDHIGHLVLQCNTTMLRSHP